MLKAKDGWMKESAARALGAIGDPCAVPPLIDTLRGTLPTTARRPVVAHRIVLSNDVLHAAMDALAKIGDQRAVEALREIKDRGHPDVAPMAAAALGRIQGKNHKP